MISEKEIDGRIIALTSQREQALNQVVLISGQMALLQAKLEEVQAENQKLKEEKTKGDPVAS